jgi:rubredoxin
MNEPCPKCGLGNMLGPSYYKRLTGGECLRYRCSTCGYVNDRPTADAKVKDAAQLADILRSP